MLSSPQQMLSQAAQGGWAVGAFNVNHLEVLQAVVQAAVEERAPVIVQTSQGALEYAGMRTLTAMIRAEAEAASVPVTLHLDHGTNVSIVEEAIASGWYTSVMIDASLKPLDENVAITRAIVDRAHSHNIHVEAELGPIPGSEDKLDVSDREAFLTNPEMVARFVRETGCDALAVSVGTRHGMYKFEDRVALDLSRLEKIRRAAGVPLVLHGASAVPQALVEKAKRFGAKLEGARGVSDAQLSKAIAHGIAKVNIDSDLRLAFTAAVDEHMTLHPEEVDPRRYLGAARDAVKTFVRQKIHLLGSSGKA